METSGASVKLTAGESFRIIDHRDPLCSLYGWDQDSLSPAYIVLIFYWHHPGVDAGGRAEGVAPGRF